MASLSNSASKQKSHIKNGLVPSHMMRLHAKAASKDFLALIGILRYHMQNQELKIAADTNPPTEKESQALARTFLRVHKTWDKYNAMLYPSVSQETYERERIARKQAAQVETDAKAGNTLTTQESSTASVMPSEPSQKNSPPPCTLPLQGGGDKEPAKMETPLDTNGVAVQETIINYPLKENETLLEESPLHPIQNTPIPKTLEAQKRKYCVLLPLSMQDSQWVAHERPWLKARYIVCENIDTQITPSYNRWIVA